MLLQLWACIQNSIQVFLLYHLGHLSRLYLSPEGWLLGRVGLWHNYGIAWQKSVYGCGCIRIIHLMHVRYRFCTLSTVILPTEWDYDDFITHQHTCTCTRVLVRTYIHTCMHAHMHARTHTGMHVHAHTSTHTTDRQTDTHTQAYSPLSHLFWITLDGLVFFSAGLKFCHLLSEHSGLFISVEINGFICI